MTLFKKILITAICLFSGNSVFAMEDSQDMQFSFGYTHLNAMAMTSFGTTSFDTTSLMTLGFSGKLTFGEQGQNFGRDRG